MQVPKWNTLLITHPQASIIEMNLPGAFHTVIWLWWIQLMYLIRYYSNPDILFLCIYHPILKVFLFEFSLNLGKIRSSVSILHLSCIVTFILYSAIDISEHFAGIQKMVSICTRNTYSLRRLLGLPKRTFGKSRTSI